MGDNIPADKTQTKQPMAQKGNFEVVISGNIFLQC